MRLALVVIATLTLAGCGNGGDVSTLRPVPGPWSSDQQAEFEGACVNGASNSYCECAVRVTMGQFPDPASLPGSLIDAGTTAANYKRDFPGC